MEITSNKRKLNPTTWLDSHGDYLYRYALMRVRDGAVAEDLLQETLLAATAASGSHEDRSSERTWLAGILKQKIFDYFRGVARTPEFQLSTAVELQEPDVFEKSGIWQGHWREDCAPLSWPSDVVGLPQSCEFWNTFERCLSCLPARMAIAFTLREMEGLSTHQICEILDISSSDLRIILHCGRVKLRQLLEAEWIRSCNTAPPANVENAERRALKTSADSEFLYRAVARELQL